VPVKAGRLRAKTWLLGYVVLSFVVPLEMSAMSRYNQMVKDLY